MGVHSPEDRLAHQREERGEGPHTGHQLLGFPRRGGGDRTSRRPLPGAERDGECRKPGTRRGTTPGSGGLSKQDVALLSRAAAYVG